jgi:hypothetical protein
MSHFLDLEREDDIDLGLNLLHVSTFSNVRVKMVEDSKAAIKECAIHDVHEGEEAMLPMCGLRLGLKMYVLS